MADRSGGMSPILGFADLVRAYAKEDIAVAKWVAESIGLEFTPSVAVDDEPITKSESDDAWGAIAPLPPKIDSAGYPSRIQDVTLWIASAIEYRETPVKDVEPVPEEWNKPMIRWSNAPTNRPIQRPLTPWSLIGERLRKSLSLALPSHRIDLSKLVNRLANGEVITTIPQQLEKRPQCLHVILDQSIWLTPFLHDQNELVSQLRRDYPTQMITTQTIASIEDDVFVPPPPSDSQVLVVSDLGEFVRSPRLRGRWIDWARRAIEQDCQVSALVPCAVTRISSPLQELFQVVSWQNDPFAWINELAERRQILKRLFVLASYCRVVQPGLLRDLRSLIPSATDVSLEADFWNSKVLTTRHHCGAALNPAVATSILQSEFLKLGSEEIQAKALEHVRNWRSAIAPETWLLEILNLPDKLRQWIAPQDIEDAEACVQVLDAVRSFGTSAEREQYEAYLHRVVPHVTKAAYSNPRIGKLLRSARFDLRPDLESLPDGASLDEVPPEFDPNGFDIDIAANKLTVRVQTESVSGRLRLATSIVSSIRYFEVSLQEQSSASSFWKSGVKPDFVSAFGRDQYGAWFEFQLGTKDGSGVVTQRMRWIRSGTFMMGSPDDEPERFDNEVLHQVTLTRGFWLADTACTQALWSAVIGKKPSHFKGAERPVEQVSYEDVVMFCKSLARQIPRLMPQMPLEAQWEYSCRAGTQTPFSFGTTISTDQANFDGYHPYHGASKGLYRGETLSVKDLPANPWGLYQMHGNVWEWCSDRYTQRIFESQTDPIGPKEGSRRVVRGGSWLSHARYVRSACRLGNDPGSRSQYLGFRLLSSADAEPSERAEVPVAEQGSEPARIGVAEENFREFRIRVGDQEPAELEIDQATKIRVVSNLEAVELQRLTKPDWAVEFGRDVYGVYGDFELESAKDQSMVRQRLRWIPPGRFQMGSPPEESGRYENESLNDVTISSGFWMFDAPCSQRLWTAVMGDNPSHFPDPNRPVESVDWKQVHEFADRLGERVDNQVFKLPTEAQWEYACRAGTSTAIYTGMLDIIGDANAPALDPIAWYGGNSGHKYDLDKSVDITAYAWLSDKQFPFTHAGTRRIKQKAPNPWGLYDTLGNVWEWCEDWYAEKLDGANVDPGGPESGSNRVIRGGSWISDARDVRSACRHRFVPGNRIQGLGFRLLSSASSAESMQEAEQVSGSRRRPRDEAEENQRTK